MHQINISIHVIAGVLGMLVAIVPYSSKKGGRIHSLYGRVFLGLMTVVILTALNGVIFFRDRPFLTVITLLSFYLSYSGYRVLKTRREGYSWVDLIVMLVALGFGIGFLVNYQSANIVWNTGVIFYTTFYLIAIVAFDLLRYFWTDLIKSDRFWIYEHVYKMTGAFTALVSAGMGTVLAAYEPWSQIVPAVASTLWLIFCLFYFPRRLGRRNSA